MTPKTIARATVSSGCTALERTVSARPSTALATLAGHSAIGPGASRAGASGPEMIIHAGYPKPALWRNGARCRVVPVPTTDS